ncbi:acyltransferase family protein [Granulicella arctica]|uniref:acyltransferase family protein n=1 Tax=Granulicella arctica TaxID=940613 RepID=UPI0021E06AEC|nr:acyltransferase [Granulicella arctica]
MLSPSSQPRLQDPGPYAGHIASLDGLRGVAVLAVMGSHLFPGGGPTVSPVIRATQLVLGTGAIGVDLFFALSGFLITGILKDSLHDSQYFRRFYARRCLRIFPLYYGALIVLLLLTPVLALQWHGMQWSLLFYLQNTGYPMPLSQFFPGHQVNLSHFWSLAVEEQFYIAWPFIVFYVRKTRHLLWLCVILSLLAVAARFGLAFTHADYQVINTSTIARMDSLLIGAALALILRTRHHDTVLRRASAVFAFSAPAALAVIVLQQIATHHPEWPASVAESLLSVRYSLLAIASTALIAWCLRPDTTLRRTFELAPLRFLGKYSYGLYVLHALFLGLILGLVRSWIGLITPNKLVAVAGSGVALFLLAIAAAYLSFNFYEKPILKLKKYFQYDRLPAGKTEARIAIPPLPEEALRPV